MGTEVRDLFTKVVHRGAWVGGLAFAQSLGRLPFLKKNKVLSPAASLQAVVTLR